MFNRKLLLRVVRVMSLYVAFTALAWLRYLTLLLVAATIIAHVAKALPGMRSEATDSDQTTAGYLCAMGMGGEWKRCASIVNHGGRHD